MKTKKGLYYMILQTAVVILLVVLDQITKGAAVSGLKDKAGIPLIPGVFELHYLENRGAAFGTLQNQRWLFLIFVFLILVGVIWCFAKLPQDRHYYPLRLIGVLVSAGAVGNMIDRIVNGYVVDFLYFSLIDFPIFNVADIYVTVSMFLLFVLLFTVYRDEDFSFLKAGKRD